MVKGLGGHREGTRFKSQRGQNCVFIKKIYRRILVSYMKVTTFL